MSVTRPAAVEAFEHAVVAREAVDEVERVCDMLYDATRDIALARALLTSERVSRLIPDVGRTDAVDALVEQLTAASSLVHVARAAAERVADELQAEFVDARSELRTLQPR